jgi:hypothetical protein
MYIYVYIYVYIYIYIYDIYIYIYMYIYIYTGLTGYSSDDINKFLWPVRIGSGVFPNDMPGERDFLSGGK